MRSNYITVKNADAKWFIDGSGIQAGLDSRDPQATCISHCGPQCTDSDDDIVAHVSSLDHAT